MPTEAPPVAEEPKAGEAPKPEEGTPEPATEDAGGEANPAPAPGQGR
jgi:hypothetical protein